MGSGISAYLVKYRTLLVVLGILILFGGSCGVGLYVAWIVHPLQPVAQTPAALRLSEKEIYIALVADAYALDRDLPAARQRLERLEAANIAQWVADLARRAAANGDAAQARRLARLAAALGIVEPTVQALGGGAERGNGLPPSPTPTPRAPTASSPLPTVVQTGQFNWVVVERRPITCAEGLTSDRRLVVRVEDAQGRPLPGIPLRVVWDGGQDRFFTGLRADDPGYADFALVAEGRYTVAVDEGHSETALDLTTEQLAAQCTDGSAGEDVIGWLVVFRRVSE